MGSEHIGLQRNAHIDNWEFSYLRSLCPLFEGKYDELSSEKIAMFHEDDSTLSLSLYFVLMK